MTPEGCTCQMADGGDQEFITAVSCAFGMKYSGIQRPGEFSDVQRD